MNNRFLNFDARGRKYIMLWGEYPLAVLFPLLCLNQTVPFIDGCLLIAAIIVDVAFCIVNLLKRANCLAGDLGFAAIVIVILFALGALIIKTGEWYYLTFLAVFIVDTVFNVAYRLWHHESILNFHRIPLIQILADKQNVPHILVSIFYMALQFTVSAGLIHTTWNKWLYSLVIVVILACIYGCLKIGERKTI